jgi:hypothetical protein
MKNLIIAIVIVIVSAVSYHEGSKTGWNKGWNAGEDVGTMVGKSMGRVEAHKKWIEATSYGEKSLTAADVAKVSEWVYGYSD